MSAPDLRRARLVAAIVAALFVLVFTHLLVTQGAGR